MPATDHDNNKHGADYAEHAHVAERLDYYYHLILTVILDRQDPATGLLPASTSINSHGNYTDAWVRDNVYSVVAPWALGLAYRRLDADRGRAYEMEHAVVKTMRGLLSSMMRQADKVERFKHTQSPADALHAKYDAKSGAPAVGDAEWGHLQIDATSLWLLTLAQMTASGLSIIFTIDEVNFVQNLIYYIGRAYRTPDYGIWERGNKINRGDTELNASSIGMAKAALEALRGLDLFGVRGSQASVVHVLADEIARCRITLESLLPWESSSKEVDAALLSTVGFPAFAVESAELADRTRDRVVARLHGKYGCKRFLRDGHQTAIEDPGRLHYEAWELQQFENIECEWPLFSVYLMLDAQFRGDGAAAMRYRTQIDSLLVESDGVSLLPELYYVPREAIAAERRSPGTCRREPNGNVPLVWAQSLYYLACLIDERLIETGEIDPLGRRLHIGVGRDPVVQVALLSEDRSLQNEIEDQGVSTQTPQQIEPIQVRRAGDLAAAYNQIGRNDRLGLTGRPVRRLRSLATSKVFRIRGRSMLFLPSFLDSQKFYLMLDRDFLVAKLRDELAYVGRNWSEPGRPTMTLMLTRSITDTGRAALLALIAEMQSGICGGVRVQLGRISELRQTSGTERIDYLHDFQFSDDPVRDLQPTKFRLTAMPGQSIPLPPTESLRIEQETEWTALTARLGASFNLYEQVEILGALARMRGSSAVVSVAQDDVPIDYLLEEVYAQAARGEQGEPFWSVVRRASGLLDKTDTSVADALVDILVRQKQVTVGKSYSDASLITRPLPPSELREKIREFGGSDVRDWMLTQEVLVYVGLLIRAEPDIFRDLLTIRIGYLIVLVASELADESGLRLEEAHEHLMQLGPAHIQRRVRSVLSDYDDAAGVQRRRESLPLQGGSVPSVGEGTDSAAETCPSGGWLRYRQRRGASNRVPAGFYARVWGLLVRCRGVIVGDKLDMRNRLESGPILSEMTIGEQNFALRVEHLLNKMDAAKYRQINIEAMMTLGDLFERTPDLRIDDYIVLDVLIGHAVRLAWLDEHPADERSYESRKSDAWREFYDRSARSVGAYIVKSLQFLTDQSFSGGIVS